MSMPKGAGPARSRPPRPARRVQLAVVPRVQQARSSRFLLLVAGLLVSGLIGLLLLNLSMQKGAFELAGIQEETEVLKTQEQRLSFEMQRMESSLYLERRATALGMVANPGLAFLDLSDGSVIGEPVRAKAPAVVPGPDLVLPGGAGREPVEPGMEPVDEASRRLPESQGRGGRR